MKKWKCPNCQKEKTTEDIVVMVLCGCGEYFQEVKDGRPH